MAEQKIKEPNIFPVKFKKELSTARQQWEDIISCNHKTEARFWLDYANFEKFHGDAAHYKEVLGKALKSVRDWPETFVDLLLTFEREEGNLETFEKSLGKCETAMKIINEKRAKQMLETTQGAKKESRRDSKSSKQQLLHRNPHKRDSKAESPVQMDSEGFKIPPTPGARLESSPKSAPESRKRSQDESDLPEPKRKKEETSKDHGVVVKHDPLRDIRTVFLSNLDYKISEDKIRDFCSPIGEIEEVRLVKDYKGRSKGYCYVVYKLELDAKKALGKDREKIDGRPVLISPCEDRKHSLPSHSKLKFSTGLEKNKVFVKNIPVSFTEKDLEELFKEHGALKSIRVVTYRNGHSKGIAYVEYEDEVSANKAVEKMDGYAVENKALSVAISNPPPRRPRNEFIDQRSSQREAPKTENNSSSAPSQNRASSFQPRASSSFGPRGRGRTQLSLVPRAVARSSVGNQKKPNSTLTNGDRSEPMDSSTGGAKPLSNSDFADMLKK